MEGREHTGRRRGQGEGRRKGVETKKRQKGIGPRREEGREGG